MRSLEELQLQYSTARQSHDRDLLEDLARELPAHTDEHGQALLHMVLGQLLGLDAAYEESLTQLQKAFAIYEDLSDMEGLRNAANEIGSAHLSIGSYLDAMKYYERAIECDELLGTTSSTGGLYNNVGIVYQRLGDYSAALENYYKAMDLAKRFNNDQYQANITVNLGVVPDDDGQP